MEFNEYFVQGMALLGAGIAMIAGLGPGIGQGYRCQQGCGKVLDAIRMLQVRFVPSWYLDRFGGNNRYLCIDCCLDSNLHERVMSFIMSYEERGIRIVWILI